MFMHSKTKQLFNDIVLIFAYYSIHNNKLIIYKKDFGKV